MSERLSLVKHSEIYNRELHTIDTIEIGGRNFDFKVGVNQSLASEWAKNISGEPEVAKWTRDPIKRATAKNILDRNMPGGPKNLVTYSLWNENQQLAAVSWYQAWNPGDEEEESITAHLSGAAENTHIVTSAFRVAANFRRLGLATRLIELTELNYALYLTQKLGANKDILFTLETDEENLAAARTYRNCGYTTIGEFDQPDREAYRGKRLLMAKSI